ncbi:MAG: dockerin type I repeat-containing protein [candidate division Zixibacteria bacterium]
MLTMKSLIIIPIVLLVGTIMWASGDVAAQSLYLTPDSVKISSGQSETFDIELWADDAVSGMNLYTVYINYNKELLDLSYLADSTFWICAAFNVDTTCLDSFCTDWFYDSIPTDSICLTYLEDSTCVDSVYFEWLVDTLCIDSIYVVETYDSTCMDSVFLEWWVDSTAIDSICIEWRTIDYTCIDSMFVEWEVDSSAIDSQFIEWDVDSTAIDSACTEWQVDTTCIGTWTCIEWDGETCIDSVCSEEQIDSTCIGLWEYTAWDLDSTYINDWVIIEWFVDSTYFNDWVCLEWDPVQECVTWEATAWHLDSTLYNNWHCTVWDVDTTVVDAWVCTEDQFDSTYFNDWICQAWDPEHIFICLGWNYTAWDVDSTCGGGYECTYAIYDSTCVGDSVEADPVSANKMNVDTTQYPVDEGPLMHPPNAVTVPFYSRFNEDSTRLIIESLIFWERIAVDGPGHLATIHLKNIGSGIHHMTIDSIYVSDVDGVELPVSGEGSVLLLNAPPQEFNLIQPVNLFEMEFEIGDSLSFSWGEAVSYYDLDPIIYELQISDTPDFTPGPDTKVFSGIIGTSIKLDATSDLGVGQLYWRVKAISSYGAERLSTQTDWSIILSSLMLPPGEFDLTIPIHDNHINTIDGQDEEFNWTKPASSIPDDTLTYLLHIWLEDEDPEFEDIILDNLDTNYAPIPLSNFDLYFAYNWRAKCINRVGLSTWSSQTFRMSFYVRGDANVDDNVNIGDAVYIINHVFKGGPGPAQTLYGDANCDGELNVGDAVYLINHVFKGGSPPCSD